MFLLNLTALRPSSLPRKSKTLRLAVWLNEAVFTDAVLERVHYSRHAKEERAKMTLTNSTVINEPLEPGGSLGSALGVPTLLTAQNPNPPNRL